MSDRHKPSVLDTALLWNYCAVGLSPDAIRKIEEKKLGWADIVNMDAPERAKVIGKAAASKIGMADWKADPAAEPADVTLFYLCKYGIETRVARHLIGKGVEYPILEFTDPVYLHREHGIAGPMARKTLEAYMSSALRASSRWEGSRAFEKLDKALENDQLRAHAKDTILSLFESGESMSLLVLKRKLPPLLRYLPSLRTLLNELLRSGKLVMDPQGFHLNRITADRYAETIEDDTEREVFKYHIHGGRARGRNRIYRSIIAKKPLLYEDRFIGTFSRYAFDLELFQKVFELPDTSFYYLQSICVPGAEDPASMLTDPEVGAAEKERLTETLEKTAILIDGKKIGRDQESILGYLLEKECQTPLAYDVFKKRYEAFIFDRCRHDPVPRSIDQATFWSTVNADKACLVGEDLTIHHVAFSADELAEIISVLDLGRFEDVEITLYPVYEENRTYLTGKGILSAAELYSLLSKNEKALDGISVMFKKYPFVSFGDADRNAQVRDLLVEFSPIGAEEFASKYEERYGVPASIVQASFLAPFSRYYLGGLFDLRGKELTSAQLEKVKGRLDSDFYELTEVKAVIEDEVPELSNKEVSDTVLTRIGYKRYSIYAFRASYQNIDQYFKKQLTEREIFTIDSIDPRLRSISRFQNVLSSLIAQREIVEFDRGQFISIRRLESTGIGKADLQAYCDKAAMLAGENGYFTVYSINAKGASARLDDFGFEDIFYLSLLKSDGRFRYKSLNNTLLFLCSQEEIQDYFEYFIEQQFGTDRSCDAYELVADIEAKYHLTLTVYKLRDLIQDSPLFFDKISEKIYIDYESYLEEV